MRLTLGLEFFSSLDDSFQITLNDLELSGSIFELLVGDLGDLVGLLELGLHLFERLLSGEGSSFTSLSGVLVLLARGLDGFALLDVFLESLLVSHGFFLEEGKSSLEGTSLQFSIDGFLKDERVRFSSLKFSSFTDLISKLELLSSILSDGDGNIEVIFDLGDLSLDFGDLLLELGGGLLVLLSLGLERVGLLGGGLLLLDHGVHLVLDRLHLAGLVVLRLETKT